MDLENYERIENQVQDVRFGTINIYMHKYDNEGLIMEKTRQSKSREDHEFNCLQSEDRLELDHKSILKMLSSARDDEHWTTSTYFEYPNEDLYDRRASMGSPAEIMKFLTHVLEGLVYLQENNYIHGDIRPEYIFYDARKARYILLDRLGDASSYSQAQRNNLVYENKNVFMSPQMFAQLTRGAQTVRHDPFKSEVFTLGMVLLSMFTDDYDISLCYNRGSRQFNEAHLKSIFHDLNKNFFSGNIERLISDFLFEGMLCLDERRRLSPRRSLKRLRFEVAPAMLRELEKHQRELAQRDAQKRDKLDYSESGESGSLCTQTDKKPSEGEGEDEAVAVRIPDLGTGAGQGGGLQLDLENEGFVESKFFETNGKNGQNLSNLLESEVAEEKEPSKGAGEQPAQGLQESEGSFGKESETHDMFQSKVEIENSNVAEGNSKKASDESVDLRANEKIRGHFEEGLGEGSEAQDDEPGAVSEEQVKTLNDIFYQNENNLETFLEKIQEKKDAEDEGDSDSETEPDSALLDKIKEKRQELKYISVDRDWVAFASKRSLQHEELCINKSRSDQIKELRNQVGLSRQHSDSQFQNLQTNDIDFSKATAEPDVIEVDTEGNGIFREKSNESLRRHTSEMFTVHNEEYLINIDGLALGDILGTSQRGSNSSGPDENSLQPFSDGFPEQDNPNEYFSYGEVKNKPMQPKMLSPEFSHKGPRVGPLSFNSSSLKLTQARGKILFRTSQDSDQPSRLVENVQLKSQFSLSNKEFLKNQPRPEEPLPVEDDLQESGCEAPSPDYFRSMKEHSEVDLVKKEIFKGLDLDLYRSDTGGVSGRKASSKHSPSEQTESEAETPEMSEWLEAYLEETKRAVLADYLDGVCNLVENLENFKYFSLDSEMNLDDEDEGEDEGEDAGDEQDLRLKIIRRKTLNLEPIDELQAKGSSYSPKVEIRDSNTEERRPEFDYEEGDAEAEILIEGIMISPKEQKKISLDEYLNDPSLSPGAQAQYNHSIERITEVENSAFTGQSDEDSKRSRKGSSIVHVRPGEHPRFVESFASDDKSRPGEQRPQVRDFFDDQIPESHSVDSEQSGGAEAGEVAEVYSESGGGARESGKEDEPKKETEQFDSGLANRVIESENSDITLQHTYSSHKASNFNNVLEFQSAGPGNRATIISETKTGESGREEDSRRETGQTGESSVLFRQNESEMEGIVEGHLEGIFNSANREIQESLLAKRDTEQVQRESVNTDMVHEKMAEEHVDNLLESLLEDMRVDMVQNERQEESTGERGEEQSREGSRGKRSETRDQIREEILEMFERVGANEEPEKDSENQTDAASQKGTESEQAPTEGALAEDVTQNEDEASERGHIEEPGNRVEVEGERDEREDTKETEEREEETEPVGEMGEAELDESVMRRKNNDQMSDFSLWERLKKRESTRFMYQNDFITLAMQNDHEHETESESEELTGTETETESNWGLRESLGMERTDEDAGSEASDSQSFDIQSEYMIRKDPFSAKELDMVEIIRLKMKKGQIGPRVRASVGGGGGARGSEKQAARKSTRKSDSLETSENLREFQIESRAHLDFKKKGEALGDTLNDSIAHKIKNVKTPIVTQSVEVKQGEFAGAEDTGQSGGPEQRKQSERDVPTEEGVDKKILSTVENPLAGLMSVDKSREVLAEARFFGGSQRESENSQSKATRPFSKKQSPDEILESVEDGTIEQSSEHFVNLNTTDEIMPALAQKQNIWNGDFSDPIERDSVKIGSDKLESEIVFKRDFGQEQARETVLKPREEETRPEDEAGQDSTQEQIGIELEGKQAQERREEAVRESPHKAAILEDKKTVLGRNGGEGENNEDEREEGSRGNESQSRNVNVTENNLSVRTQEKYNYDKQVTRKRASWEESFDTTCRIDTKESIEDSDQALRRTMKVKPTSAVSEVFLKKADKTAKHVTLASHFGRAEPQMPEKPQIVKKLTKPLNLSSLNSSFLHSKVKDSKSSGLRGQSSQLNTDRSLRRDMDTDRSLKHEPDTARKETRKKEPDTQGPGQSRKVIQTRREDKSRNKWSQYDRSQPKGASRKEHSTGKSIVTFVNAFDTDHLVESIPVTRDTGLFFVESKQSVRTRFADSFKVRTVGNSIRRVSPAGAGTGRIQKSFNLTQNKPFGSENVVKVESRFKVQTKIITKPQETKVTYRPAQVKYIYRSPSPVQAIARKPQRERQTRKLDQRVYQRKSKKKPVNFISKNIQRVRDLSESRRRIRESKKSETVKNVSSRVMSSVHNTLESEQGSYKEIYSKRIQFYVNSIRKQKVLPLPKKKKREPKKSAVKKYAKTRFGQKPGKVYRSEIDRISDNIKRSLSPRLLRTRQGGHFRRD